MSVENKIVYYFLRISAERFASDLQHFQKEICNLTDEELYGMVSYFDNIRDNLVHVKKELEKRLK
jgi:hypothetical protein